MQALYLKGVSLSSQREGISFLILFPKYHKFSFRSRTQIPSRDLFDLSLLESMDALRKQATRLREQVARQQQAVFKQFGGGGYGNSDLITDEAELQQHQKLEKLYISTRAGKHFQRDIVRGVEGYIVTGSKQVEIGSKLSEDSRKYGAENTCTNGNTLSKAALSFGKARVQMEKERGNLLKALGTQVAEPLRAMVMGAPLEDARHLAQRYDRMRQEAEAQAIEVSKRQAKVREAPGNVDNNLKLEAAESKLQELKSNMTVLGKEAAAAMTAVEGQQQRLTLQRLIAMIESERTYHQRILQILDQLEGEMVSERQRIEASPSPVLEIPVPPPPSYEEANGMFSAHQRDGSTDAMGYFLGEVVHSFQAESEAELNLSVGDFVVVRKVSNNGWAEGECKGKAGWFPFGYVEKRDRVLASKMAEVF
ncbi:putative SH3 domain, AH/BAR domain superfamily, SH3-like domain superfamily protein [Dioscorea sansibarensis]